MSFWPFSTLNGYTRAQTVSSSPDNSTVFYFGPKNPNRKKKRKSKNSPDHSAYPQNNQDNATSSRYEHELLIVKKQDRFEYYRVPLLKNENLHTIAMKYGCSVWELKRANHLWGLQDVHALPSLVIPAPKNSYRAELLAKSGGRLVGENQQSLQAGGSRDPDGADEDLQDTSGDLASGVLEVGSASAGATGSDDQRRPVSLRQAMSSSDSLTATDCDRFLRTLDADLEQIKQSTCFLKESLPEAASYLNTQSVFPPHSSGYLVPSWLRRLKGSGVDGGLSWRGAVCLVCVLCLLVPALLYLLIVRGR